MLMSVHGLYDGVVAKSVLSLELPLLACFHVSVCILPILIQHRVILLSWPLATQYTYRQLETFRRQAEATRQIYIAKSLSE